MPIVQRDQSISNGKKGLCAHYKDSKLIVYQGDITEEKVDAIVLPITRQRYEIVKDIMPVSFGDVVVRHEEDMPCKMVLYAIVFKSEDELLQQQQRFHFPLMTVRQIICNSLVLASKHNAKIVSMSALGPGLNVEDCAETTFEVVEEFLEGLNESVEEIRFINEDKQTSLFSKEIVGRYQAFEIRISDLMPEQDNQPSNTTDFDNLDFPGHIRVRNARPNWGLDMRFEQI